MYAHIHLGIMIKGTQDIKKAISQDIYHKLGVGIVMGTARISSAVVLAVDYSALYSFLNLMDEGKTSGNCIQITTHVTSSRNYIPLHFCSFILSKCCPVPLYAGCSEP